MSRILPAFLAALALAVAAPSPALAQAWPNKPITIIVPFAPGGGSDFIGRFIAQRLSTALGQPVLVENRPGAGSLLGVEVASKAKPDGYTLALIASSYTVLPALYKMSFDPVNDITPIIQISPRHAAIWQERGFAGESRTAHCFVAGL